MEVKWKLLRRIRLFATPWPIQSTEFSRPEYWSGWPFPSPEDLPNPGIKPWEDSLPAEPQGKPDKVIIIKNDAHISDLGNLADDDDANY